MSNAPVHRVLLVDDEPLARLVARKSLEAADCFVVEGEGCAQGEVLWKNGAYDLVVLDHRMEDGTGLDLLRKRRGDAATQPVIYLTADAEDIGPDIRKDLSIAAVLSKPLDPEALKSAARAVLEGKGEAARVEYRGRFQLVTPSNPLGRESLEVLRGPLGDAAWVALDARDITDLRDDAIPALIEWAESCRRRGGRLCLAGLRATLANRLAVERVDRLVDVLPDLRALEALGRRLSSASERLSLLDSVVRSL